MSVERAEDRPANGMHGVTTRLAVIEDVRYLKAAYLRFLDTQQWDSLAALFMDDATFVLASAGGALVLHGSRHE